MEELPLDYQMTPEASAPRQQPSFDSPHTNEGNLVPDLFQDRPLSSRSAPRLDSDHFYEELPKVFDIVDALKEHQQEEAQELKRLRQEKHDQNLAAQPGLEAPDGGRSQARPRKAGGRKKVKEDIFHDFGKEHDSAPIQEIKVNGMVVHRLNYKRYWNSDPDLNRWTDAMKHQIRYEKLLTNVRHRWHTDLRAEQSELAIQHNSMIRRKQNYSAELGTASSNAIHLRELQRKIQPMKTKKKQHAAAMMDLGFGGGLGLGIGMGGVAPKPPVEPAAELDDHAFDLRDMEMPPAYEAPEDQEGGNSAFESPMLSRRRDSRGSQGGTNSHNLQEFAHTSSMPTLARIPASPSGTVSGGGTTKLGLSSGEMPRTMALLIFRNADRLHTGETLFVKRWPPPSFRDFTILCEQVCRPLCPPALVLYTPDMQRIRSLEEVQNGAVYLIKGGEGFDPPKLFFSHATKDGEISKEQQSLRGVKKAKVAKEAAEDSLQRYSIVPSPLTSLASVYKAPEDPSVESPPWPTRGRVQMPHKMDKWQVDEFLGHTLSWSGQGMPHTHFHLDTYEPVLKSRFSCPDRYWSQNLQPLQHSASATF
eukprot:TRINITY_DN22681_c0_g1_i1.p1 TRINITY_DN22681_c0_g1~~TRINITY_DN22681_c0_g1_i1.p1  ORF type:complete len:589 (+),score=122.44 TRINITY_DN22681_c0_g1_i1:148-1914(+)